MESFVFQLPTKTRAEVKDDSIVSHLMSLKLLGTRVKFFTCLNVMNDVIELYHYILNES